ncbi:Hsp20/alpha crystallin family protein [Rubritalea spongiae]|uniref:Hsp20/alpha crystallin family protein n=1 Tax=Rubritalea spongiae TaxID=430797 RepID=A0ABW5DZT4_9BACT
MRTFSPNTTRSLLDEFNTLFDSALRPQASHQLFSTDSGWLIRIDLPGFDKEDISLNYEDKSLILKAEQSAEQEPQRPALSRRYALGEEVDVDSITAKLELGVLDITLPKKEEQEESVKTIEIQ